MNLDCTDFVAVFGIWVDGGGVMAPARAGELSMLSLLLLSLVGTGLVEGLDPLRRSNELGLGVCGFAESDMFTLL